ncbi:cell division protein ZapA [Gammaproteobacteria bacterium]|nr:cell division protein ZapA [Gammaproteobacteria bacterium]
MSNTSSISITILGQQYNIACVFEERAALTASAQLLDERLRLIRDQSRLSLDQAAIMTALNLAHELLNEKTKLESLQNKTRGSLNKLIARINNEIE